MARRRAMEGSPLPMEVIMRDNLGRMRSVAMGITTGPMASRMLATGARIKWMGRGSLNGRMGRCIRETSSTTRERATVLSSGLTDGNILENGKQVSSMALERISVRRDKKSKASGRMEERSSGSTRSTETRTSCSHEHSIFDQESHKHKLFSAYSHL